MKESEQEFEQSFNDAYKAKEDIYGHPYQELQSYFNAYPKKVDIPVMLTPHSGDVDPPAQ